MCIDTVHAAHKTNVFRYQQGDPKSWEMSEKSEVLGNVNKMLFISTVEPLLWPRLEQLCSVHNRGTSLCTECLKNNECQRISKRMQSGHPVQELHWSTANNTLQLMCVVHLDEYSNTGTRTLQASSTVSNVLVEKTHETNTHVYTHALR